MAKSETNIILQNRFTATLSVPVTKPVVIYADMSITFQQERFIEYRDKAFIHDAKICFDRCRALLKWAETCNAELNSIKNVHTRRFDSLEFTFSFTGYDDMSAFMKDLYVSVNGATME